MKISKKLTASLIVAAIIFGLFTTSWGAAPVADAAEDSDATFTDVTDGAWYAEAANWCKAQGILLGDTFSPDTAMTRATVAEALYRAEGSPSVSGGASFSDIEAGSIYASAAAWTSANGVMSGYGGGVFGANDPVTREQMAAILWRYAGSPAAGSSQDFADKASIASYGGLHPIPRSLTLCGFLTISYFISLST